MVKVPSAEALLRLWEQGRSRPPVERAVLLAAAAGLRGAARLTIGERDRCLLDLREALFGGELQCLFDCARCGSTIEFGFAVSDVQIPYGRAEAVHEIAVAGYEVGFRLPVSEDLAALTGASGFEAERQLLSRCVLSARRDDAQLAAASLPEAVAAAVSERMSEADAQAVILLDLACPTCTACTSAVFDIVGHLWAELDAWARRMFREVHALSVSYGWSEAAILRMSPGRRRAYLDLIDA